MRNSQNLRRLWALVFACMACLQVQAAPALRIGVLSFNDKAQTLQQWSPTADYLHQKLPSQSFQIVPLFYDELNAQVANRQLDFVLTNPEHYVVLRNVFQLSSMVTIARDIRGKSVNTFGSVIFTRADNQEMVSLRDVRGKRVAAVGLFSLGGFLAAADVFKSEHVDLQSDPSITLRFIGLPHSVVVQAVLANTVDVGIVRTGVLEEMASKGTLDMGRIRVLNPQPDSLFPQRLSTRLYAEWPFAVTPQLDPAVAKGVAVALLSVPSNSPAARAGGYSGFSPPANYTPVEEVMRRLNVYPGIQSNPAWLDFWEMYSAYIQLTALVLLFVVLGVAIYLYVSNRSLRRLTALYRKAQDDLEIMAVAFNSQVGLIVTDRVTRIVRANHAFCAVLGYTEQAIVGAETSCLRGAGVPDGVLESVWKYLQSHNHWQGELLCRHAKGFDVPCIVTISAVRADRAGLSGFVGSFVDISAQKATEAEIRQLAYFDQLTDLPNRRYFLEKLEAKITVRQPSAGLGALLFIDLDHFKLLNDSHGHSVGDELLRLIAGRLRHIMDGNALAARLGGDEFVVMLQDLSQDRQTAMHTAMEMAQEIKDAILAPYRLSPSGGLVDSAQKLRYSCSGSIGVALFGEVEEEVSEVLKRADMAMYQAKQAGRNVVRQFDPSTQELLNQRTALVSDLNLALSETQFQLYYQVQVNAANMPVGAECLLRWNHPTLGMVSPALFIPLAEDCGAISFIGYWVMRSACRTLARWQGMPHLRDLSLSINVSPKQLAEADFVAKLAAVVQEFGVNTQRIILEITEGAVLQNVDEMIRKMEQLCALGVRLSIDDFGTGYSSLSYLQRLPISEIKIDRSFVQGMSGQEESYAIVGAIMALAERLHFSVVAEGVETEEQKARLLVLGAPTLQGFLIARPTDLQSFEDFVVTDPVLSDALA